MKHQTEEPIPIQLVAPELSDRVAEVVHKMIRRNPDERYQTAGGGGDGAGAVHGRRRRRYVGGEPADGGSRRSGLGDQRHARVGAAPEDAGADLRHRDWDDTIVAAKGVAPARARWRASSCWAPRLAGAAAVALMGRSASKVSSNKDQEPSPPDKDGDTKDKTSPKDRTSPKDKDQASPKDKDKGPPVNRKTPLDHLADVPIPVSKRPLRPLQGLVGVLGEPRGRHWSGAPISRVMFSRDGRLLATASGFGDNAIHIWDPETLLERGRLATGGAPATNFTLGGDGTWVAVMALDGSIRVFDITDAGFGKTLAQYQVPSLGVATFSPDGRLAVGTITDRDARTTRTVKVWDTRTGNLRRTYTLNDGFITTAAFVPGGLKLAVSALSSVDARGHATVRLYDLEADKLLHSIGVGLGYGIPIFTADGKQLLVVTNSGIKTYDVASGEMLHDVAVPFTASPLLSPDGKLLAFVARTREGKTFVHFYDVAAGKMATHSAEVENTVFFTQFTPDSKALIAFGHRQVIILDPSNAKPLPPLKGWSGGTLAVGMAPNGRRLAIATSEPALRMWDFPSREEILPASGTRWPRSLSGPCRRSRNLGRLDGVRRRQDDQHLRRWDLPRGEPIVHRDTTLSSATWAYDRQHHHIAFQHFVTEGSNTGSAIKIIHAGTGKDVTTLPPLPNAVWISAPRLHSRRQVAGVRHLGPQGRRAGEVGDPFPRRDHGRGAVPDTGAGRAGYRALFQPERQDARRAGA